MENGLRSCTALKLWNGAKPYVFMIIIRGGIAALTILAKFAINEGMSIYTFVVYRYALATLVIAPFAFVFERNAGPKITWSIFFKIVALALLEPVLDQTLFILGMKLTSATYSAAINNIVPALTFSLAWILRLEKVNLKEMKSISKLMGTIVSVLGAMVMTLYKGLIVGKGSVRLHGYSSNADDAHKDMVMGSIFIFVSCFCWTGFVLLQTITIREYPYELSLSTWICFVGAIEATVVATVLERGRAAAWSIGWNSKLLTIVFAGVINSGLAYYLQGSVTKEKGPVFATAFNPLTMILVAVPGLLLIGEDLFLGGVIGSLLIILGLYMVLWGKSGDPPPENKKKTVDLATDV